MVGPGYRGRTRLSAPSPVHNPSLSGPVQRGFFLPASPLWVGSGRSIGDTLPFECDHRLAILRVRVGSRPSPAALLDLACRSAVDSQHMMADQPLPCTNDRRPTAMKGVRRGYDPKAALDSRAGLMGWRLHDLRRTAATRMAELSTLPHVIEAVLNHVSGHRAGVAGIYNRATYTKEMREALERWAQRVEEITK